MSKKFTKEFKRNYKKTSKAVDKWVMRNPGKAMALNAAGDCGLVAIGAAVAIKAMKKKNPLAIETTEKKEKKEFFLKRIFKKKEETPATPETPAAPETTSTEAPAPAES